MRDTELVGHKKITAMRRCTALAYLLILISLPAFSQTYITNVNVLDVEKMKLLPAQTVVIDNNKIINAGPVKKITVPAGARTIDGTGKYLSPGLVDAHVHFFQSGGLYARPDGLDLRKYTSP